VVRRSRKKKPNEKKGKQLESDPAATQMAPFAEGVIVYNPLWAQTLRVVHVDVDANGNVRQVGFESASGALRTVCGHMLYSFFEVHRNSRQALDFIDPDSTRDILRSLSCVDLLIALVHTAIRGARTIQGRDQVPAAEIAQLYKGLFRRGGKAFVKEAANALRRSPTEDVCFRADHFKLPKLKPNLLCEAVLPVFVERPHPDEFKIQPLVIGFDRGGDEKTFSEETCLWALRLVVRDKRQARDGKDYPSSPEERLAHRTAGELRSRLFAGQRRSLEQRSRRATRVSNAEGSLTKEEKARRKKEAGGKNRKRKKSKKQATREKIASWRDHYSQEALGPWRCPEHGRLPLRDHPLRGAGDTWHCPLDDCDASLERDAAVYRDEIETLDSPRDRLYWDLEDSLVDDVGDEFIKQLVSKDEKKPAVIALLKLIDYTEPGGQLVASGGLFAAMGSALDGFRTRSLGRLIPLTRRPGPLFADSGGDATAEDAQDHAAAAEAEAAPPPLLTTEEQADAEGSQKESETFEVPGRSDLAELDVLREDASEIRALLLELWPDTRELIGKARERRLTTLLRKLFDRVREHFVKGVRALMEDSPREYRASVLEFSALLSRQLVACDVPKDWVAGQACPRCSSIDHAQSIRGGTLRGYFPRKGDRVTKVPRWMLDLFPKDLTDTFSTCFQRIYSLFRLANYPTVSCVKRFGGIGHIHDLVLIEQLEIIFFRFQEDDLDQRSNALSQEFLVEVGRKLADVDLVTEPTPVRVVEEIILPFLERAMSRTKI
jgi:hypothetical protein